MKNPRYVCARKPGKGWLNDSTALIGRQVDGVGPALSRQSMLWETLPPPPRSSRSQIN